MIIHDCLHFQFMTIDDHPRLSTIAYDYWLIFNIYDYLISDCLMIYWHYTYIYIHIFKLYIHIIYWYMYCDACLGWPQTLKSLLAPSSHPAIIYLQQHLRQLCTNNCPLMTLLQYLFLHALSTAWSLEPNRSQPTNDLDSAWPFGTVASARNGSLVVIPIIASSTHDGSGSDRLIIVSWVACVNVAARNSNTIANWSLQVENKHLFLLFATTGVKRTNEFNMILYKNLNFFPGSGKCLVWPIQERWRTSQKIQLDPNPMRWF